MIGCEGGSLEQASRGTSMHYLTCAPGYLQPVTWTRSFGFIPSCLFRSGMPDSVR